MKQVLSICIMLILQFTLMAQDQEDQLKIAEQKLAGGISGVSDILGDKAFMPLHSLTSFREIIKKYARPGKVNIVTADEPGTRIRVKVQVMDEAGTPQANIPVYVYQTSSKGWYSDTAPHIQMNEGDRQHARLFGYVITNDDGRFELSTIKPRGYPQSNLPAHIHIEVTAKNNKSAISELLFDDDPRLAGDIRSRAVSAGFVISKNRGTTGEPVYSYVVKAR